MFYKDGALKYHYSPHSPTTIIPTLISESSTILDVGCNTGYLAKLMKKKGCIVDGIDIHDESIKIAKKYCRTVYKKDLYQNKLGIPHIKYDYIIFSDILEHLPRPDLILPDAKKYLKKNGKIIISLPNIARVELRIKHLLGDFTYAPGIMGHDHLRFFTKHTATKMIEESGFHVYEVIPTGLGHMIKIFPNLTAFQFIYLAKINEK